MRALLVVLALAIPAAAEPLFLSILPAGQDGLVPASTIQPGPHATDQLAPYRDLIRFAPGLSESDLGLFFKDARLTAPAVPESVEQPRPGVTIARDAFGVPHVAGDTRSDVFFGAGWVTARDRLFLADALRHMGRGRFSEFAGAALGLEGTIGFDRTYYRVAGHSEAELQQIVEDAAAADPVFGPQVLADTMDFVAGVNAYIAAARVDPARMPAEYVLLGIPLRDWMVTDAAATTIAFTTVIGFANGGGGEHENVLLQQALAARFGEKEGRALFEDLRAREDPEAPVTTTRRADYLRPRRIDPDAVATFDPGSFVSKPPLEVSGSASGALLGARAAAPVRFPAGMSNFLAITGRRAAGGRPILVGGPQTGYFAPQALIEMSLVGGGVAAHGATPPGLPYMVLGHTNAYAWTATSGGSDLADVRVERLCTPPGGAPGSGTVFHDECRPILRRVDTWRVGTQTVTANVERTVHGPVVGRATVKGEPVVLALERSTFGHEVDSGRALVLLNTGLAKGPEAFRDALASMTGTLNWLYVDDTDVAFFHSGRYPIRARGVDPDLPSWGTGEWEWQGFLAAKRQPFARNPRQGFITSWNNKPARRWRAADRNFSYGPLHRSLLFDVRLEQAVALGPVDVAGAVDAMADAATVDLRGAFLLPEALPLAEGAPALASATALLRGWLARGAHRLDRDGDGRYDDAAAVALMDEWYPRLVHAMFDPQLAGIYDLLPMGLDDAPSSHLGSAYQGGFYGYVHRALRQARGGRGRGGYRVLRCGAADGCAAAVRASLTAAVAALTQRFGSSDPAAWTFDPANDEIRFSTGGLAAVPPIPWQNRPTYQQVVQIR